MAPNYGSGDAVRVVRWAAMAVATYAVTGVVYAILVLASARGPLLSEASWEVMTALILPAFYANPARALVAPGVATLAFVVAAVAVVLGTRGLQSLYVLTNPTQKG
ncbi:MULTISPECIES: hypothetical protein [Halorussus]|uniref:hypothetical protein n=1 Tax=Halorussus TaxID=1070314 RepID=UPI000E210676|nr:MULTISPECIES: hypothetical protein [Halorussus]NHN60943.1 hypothetical protein [Halorussus sp. JP-T4]